MDFSWDESKAAANYQKHGVAFAEAGTVFFDDFARVMYDPDHSLDEDRFLILGMSEGMRVLVVCHCYRLDNERIRIISARKATKQERTQYERFRNA